MGHNSKKKKKQKGRGRAPSKDHTAHSGDDNDLLDEELTALTAIFQEDFKIISESPHLQFTINVRPYSSDMAGEDVNVAAHLFVRCLPGYPHKCPKLQIVPEKGLSKEDADALLSLLLEQARVNAREGRVMIFNLVEAAQEFLSVISPTTVSPDLVPCLSSSRKEQSHDKDAAVICDTSCFLEGPYVYVSIDLYSDLCGEEASWGGRGTKSANDYPSKIGSGQSVPYDNARGKSILPNFHTSANTVNVAAGRSLQNPNLDALGVAKHVMTQRTVPNLNVLEEETENDKKSGSPTDSDPEFVLDTSERSSDSILHADLDLVEKITKADSWDSEGESPASSYSFTRTHDNEILSKKKDLLMIHLLHLACSANGPLSHALPEISLELYKLRMLSERARDLAAESPSVFGKAFHHAFEHHVTSSRVTPFWKTVEDNASSLSNSRYLNDFDEIRSLGRGGFGHVVLCKNKLDGRQYAVKKIRLKDKSLLVNEKILREVATLSRLQHQHVVRYYQAWFETEFGNHHGEGTYGYDSRTANSCSWSLTDAGLTNASGPDSSHETTYLYIQMEYCPRTLRQDFELDNASFDKDLTYTWHLFRQIVEGLAHIHSQGIIHRDLTPSNIFFDARNDVKIGDFGLAKFLKLEQLDPDQCIPTETTGASMDGTGQVGTFFYTAPEIEQRWPQINEKVDMYSLGVVFFELWHPFATAMERHIVLSDLKQKGTPPPSWITKFPKQTTILRRLMSPSPSDRPSATELLQNDLPPRMEDEWLNDILRTIQSSEDTYVYDRVVSSIFDMDRIVMRAKNQHGGSTKMTRFESSFTQYAELDTEIRDNAIEITKEVFRQHGAKRLEISPMRILDGYNPIDRKTVKVLTPGGDMLELCHELRLPFVNWVVTNQILSFKRYEVSWVYRRGIGHSTPNRFFQGDFDIIGGSPPLTEAEAVKVVMDIAAHFSHSSAIDIRLNHGQLLDAIWAWAGIASELRQNVAELLSSIGSSCPQSTSRKSNWGFIRRQLLQDLHLSEAVVDRLQTADIRFCGSTDQALARLRGALSPDKSTRKALEELSILCTCLRVWNIEKHVYLDVLMPPTENYYRGLFFQVYLKENTSGSISDGTLLAVGGRYDSLVHQMWNHEYKSNPPGGVGVSLALEKILVHCSVDIRPFRIEPGIHVLVCSRGGGGLLQERMELVAELWQANVKAEYVPLPDPSLTVQYEYATEHDIKCLIIITEAGLSQTGLVRVRHIELKKEKEIERGVIIKFLTDAVSTQFRDLSIWS